METDRPRLRRKIGSVTVPREESPPQGGPPKCWDAEDTHQNVAVAVALMVAAWMGGKDARPTGPSRE